MNVPPSPAPPPVQHPRESGLRCCGMGCLTLLFVAFLFFAALFAGAWFLCGRAMAAFTSTQPVNIAVDTPSDAEFAAADGKLNQMRTALRNQQAATFTFTAAELNALIARHPDLAPRKGKVRCAIADSIATVDMSVPLDTTDFRWMKRRWFNGSANFGFIYADEGFRFDANWLEANGHRFSSRLLSATANIFSKSFSRGFEEGVGREGGSESWRNVKTMTLDEDKLVIITRGG